MKLYELKQRYSKITGEKSHKEQVFDKEICEFSGEPVEQLVNQGYPSYKLEYENQDPHWTLQSTYNPHIDLNELDVFQEKGPAFRREIFLNDYKQAGAYMIKRNHQDQAMQDFFERYQETELYSFGLYLRDLRIETTFQLLKEGEVDFEHLPGYLP